MNVYYSVGAEGFPTVDIPATTFPVKRGRHIIDSFGLQADPVTHFGVTGITTSGYWDGWLVGQYGDFTDDAVSNPQWEPLAGMGSQVLTNSYWPEGWEDDVPESASRFTLNRTALTDWCETKSAQYAADEEVWFLPNIECNNGEFNPWAVDPLNPTAEEETEIESIIRFYRMLYYEWRIARPNGLVTNYIINGSLYPNWTASHGFVDYSSADFRNHPSYIFCQQMNDLFANSISGAGYSMFDGMDGITTSNYWTSTDTITTYTNRITGTSEEIGRLATNGQLKIAWVSPYKINNVLLTEEELKFTAKLHRDVGFDRLIMWGYVPNAIENGDSRYWPYWENRIKQGTKPFTYTPSYISMLNI